MEEQALRQDSRTAAAIQRVVEQMEAEEQARVEAETLAHSRKRVEAEAAALREAEVKREEWRISRAGP